MTRVVRANTRIRIAFIAFVLFATSLASHTSAQEASAPSESLGNSPSISGALDTGDYQNAPAITEDLIVENSLLDFSAINYFEPGVGPKPFADYAPIGYYPLDYQEAPGAPSYTPIPMPETITPEERKKLVTRGIYPGSLLAPATNTSLRFSGFVRAGSTFDFNPVGTPDQFVTNSIPVPQQVGQNVNFSARPTRLSMDSWTPTSFNDWQVHTFVQFDFFSGNPPGVGSSSNPRLRFAYVDYGYFRIGQDTTVFMDPSSFPFTADFAGPRGLVNVRQSLARITLPIGENIFWAAAVEQPFSDITTSGLGNNVQDVPDFTSHFRVERDLWHTQVSGIVRTLGYRPTAGSLDRKAGGGANFTSNFHPWAFLLGTNPIRDEDPSGLTRSRIRLQYAFGWGIARYIQDTSGLGLDGEVDPLTGAFDTLYACGWTTTYEHWFNAHWVSNTTYSADFTGHAPNQPTSTYRGAKYLATSIWWVPVRNLSCGVEYLYGERQNIDLQRGVAHRIQSVFQYNF
jgi:hypothetical protein